MGAVLVHIDLDAGQPHASSVAALAAGRAIASSWGATLYAALVVQDPAVDRISRDSTGEIVSTKRLPGLDAIQTALGRAGADKVVVAMTDAPVAPLWAAVGGPWQGVLDHLRPRLVLFGADAPSAAELGPRTGARIGARLLQRARATGGDQVELRDRDGGTARASDGGAAVAMIGAHPRGGACEADVDLVVLVMPGHADERIELTGHAPAELAQTTGTIVAIADDAEPDRLAAAQRLAQQLGAPIVGGIDRQTALAPELCVAIGEISLDLAGATSLVRIGPSSGKGVQGVLEASALASLVTALDDEAIGR